MEASLQEMQKQLNDPGTEAQVQEIGEALSLADATAAAGQAMSKGDLEKAAAELAKMEMPELDRYARSQDKQGVQVLGLALDTPENIHEFLDRVPVAYPILVDTPGPADASVWLGNLKGVLPYSVLVGADGTVLKQKIGPFAPGEIDGWAKMR